MCERKTFLYNRWLFGKITSKSVVVSCSLHAWPTHCWKTKKSARDNHVIVCNLSKYSTRDRLYDIRSDDCSRYASNSDKTLSHCIWVALGVSPALRPDTRPCLHPTATRDPQLDADSIVSELGSRPRLQTPSGLSPSPRSGLWPGTSTSNLTLSPPDLDSDLDLGNLNLWRIRFAESEFEFGWDSVKPSIQCANPNPDSLRIQLWHEFISETGSA